MLKICLWCTGRLILLALTVAVIVAVWTQNANLVNAVLDMNGDLVKKVSGWIDKSGRLLTALRAMNMERVLLFIEVGAIIIAILAYCRYLLRRIGRRFAGSAKKPAPAANVLPGPGARKRA